jgi:hypothetical protein
MIAFPEHAFIFLLTRVSIRSTKFPYFEQSSKYGTQRTIRQSENCPGNPLRHVMTIRPRAHPGRFVSEGSIVP